MPRRSTPRQIDNATITHRYMVQRWIYQSIMTVSVFGHLAFFTRAFREAGELSVSWILLIISTVCVATVFSAAQHNFTGRVYDVWGIAAAVWPADTMIRMKLVSILDPDPELSELCARVMLLYQIVYMLVLHSWVRRRFKKTVLGMHACTIGLCLCLVPVASTVTIVGQVLERKWRQRSTTDILTRARLGRGSEYVVDYHVASVFYDTFGMIAALVGTKLQDTELKSLVAALGVFVLPNLLSVGDGPQCFSLSAALTGVVEVKSVDHLLIMTARTRQELLKSLLRRRRRSDSISAKNLCFARATLRGALEIRKTFTTSEIRDTGVDIKICRHVIRYPDGERWKVEKTDYYVLHVYRNQDPDVIVEEHDIDACLFRENEDLDVEGTLVSRKSGNI